MKLLKRLIREDDGAGMVEYGLLIALIGVLLIGAIGVLTGAVDGLFRDVAGILGGGGGEAPPAEL